MNRPAARVGDASLTAVIQRLHEPKRPPLLRRRATFFQRGLLVLGPVAVVLVLLVLTPAWPV